MDIENPGNWRGNTNATLADWATTVNNGMGWAVVQQHHTSASSPNWGSPIGDAVYVVFSPSMSSQINFSADPIYWGPQKQAHLTTSSGYVYSVRIQFDDLGSAEGSDQCTPVISLALRDSTAYPWFKELFSVAATSTESAGGYSLRPLFVNAPVNYPSGYEGEIVPGTQPAAKYVAAGDSFSTGEGNPAFEAGTAEDGVNECHRSPQAYPRLLQDALNLGSTAFVACSGATTNDVLGIAEGDDPHGKWNEPAQIDALSAETEVVTITIGGNDIGFGDFGYECLFPVNLTHGTCDEFTDIYEDTVWKIENELPDKLENVYEVLLYEAENADIYVADYPTIAPYKSINDPFDQDCGGLYDEFPNNWGDARAAYEVTDLLNDVIEDAVEAVRAQHSTDRLKFVPVDEGAFVGHDVCSSDSYFHGLVLPDTEYSIHPNTKGHIAYAGDLAGALS